jgi:hypothetical protein
MAASLLVAAVLCGSESVNEGRRNVYAVDQFNHLKHTQSAAEALLSGQFPPRVSPVLTEGLGNPYHQFYSPLAHSVMAAASIVLGDVVLGYSVTQVMMTAIAFFHACLLGLYLTRSGPCSAFAGFVFVTAPYLAVDRTVLGSSPEHFAFCLLPAVLYWNLRAVSLRSFRNWALAVLSTSALLLSHLITGFFFLFFYAVFIVIAGIIALSRRKPAQGTDAGDGFPLRNGVGDSERRGRLGLRRKAFLRKAFGSASVAAATLLVCAYYLAPIALYQDLIMKSLVLPGMRTAASAAAVQPLTVASLSDVPWNWSQLYHPMSWKYQAGLLILASHAAFAWLCLTRRSDWAFPFSLVSWITLVFAVFPQVFSVPPLDRIDIVQNSFRFLGFFALEGSVAGALVLREIFRRSPCLPGAVQAATSAALICLALALAAPYIYPRSVRSGAEETLDARDIIQTPGLWYNEDNYLRAAPPEGASGWVEPGRKAVSGQGAADDKIFHADLAEYYRSSGGQPGEALLDILYFPGLQQVEASVMPKRGKAAPLGGIFTLGTYWQRRDAVKNNDVKGPGAFHGLRLTGLPEEGFMEVKVRFVGMRWANAVSLLACSLFFGAAVAVGFRHGWRRLRSGGGRRRAGTSGCLRRKPVTGRNGQIVDKGKRL